MFKWHVIDEAGGGRGRVDELYHLLDPMQTDLNQDLVAHNSRHLESP